MRTSLLPLVTLAALGSSAACTYDYDGAFTGGSTSSSGGGPSTGGAGGEGGTDVPGGGGEGGLGGGAGGAPPPCVIPLADAFADGVIDTALWSPNASAGSVVSEGSGNLFIELGGAFPREG